MNALCLVFSSVQDYELGVWSSIMERAYQKALISNIPYTRGKPGIGEQGIVPGITNFPSSSLVTWENIQIRGFLGDNPSFIDPRFTESIRIKDNLLCPASWRGFYLLKYSRSSGLTHMSQITNNFKTSLEENKQKEWPAKTRLLFCAFTTPGVSFLDLDKLDFN